MSYVNPIPIADAPAFQIPMRGNEYFRWTCTCPAGHPFQIPMRGNEIKPRERDVDTDQVSNPHEG